MARVRRHDQEAASAKPGHRLADVEVDRDVVVQALLNLMSNAAKYGGADQPIEVTVEGSLVSDPIESVQYKSSTTGVAS